MTDVQPAGSASPQVPPTCRLLEGSGICADYRKKIDTLHDERTEAGGARRVVIGVGAFLLTLLGGLGAYLWSRIEEVDVLLLKAREEYQAAVSGVFVPVGTVVAWVADLPPLPTYPNGIRRELRVGDWHYHWQVCDGRQLRASDHDEIANVLKETYGKADAGMVKLPDFTSHFLRGKSADRVLGKSQTDSTRNHQHLPGDLRAELGIIGANVYGNPVATPKEFIMNRVAAFAEDPDEDDRSTDRFSSGVRVGGRTGLQEVQNDGASETRPINYAVHWIIRVR